MKLYRVYKNDGGDIQHTAWCVDREDSAGVLEDRTGRWEPLGTFQLVLNGKLNPAFSGTTVECAEKALNLAGVPARWEHLFNWDAALDGCYARV